MSYRCKSVARRDLLLDFRREAIIQFDNACATLADQVMVVMSVPMLTNEFKTGDAVSKVIALDEF